MGVFAGILENVEQTSVVTKDREPRYGRHPSEEDIAALVDGSILPRRRRAIILHLIDCDKCRRTVSEVVISCSFIKKSSEGKS
jgi:hypothetical protein